MVIRGNFEDTISNLLDNALNIVAKLCSIKGLKRKSSGDKHSHLPQEKKKGQKCLPCFLEVKIHFSKEVK